MRNTTSYTHDANGNTLTRSHDSQDAEFVYDARDLVSKVTNTRTGKASKVTSYGYTARGQIASTTKPNGNTVNYDYNLDGSVASQRETTSGGGLVAEHVLAYNANGHRVRDEATIQNADDPSAYLDHVYTYEFDPQDRLSSVTKRDASDSSIVSSESYVHDANANVIKQTINGTTTSFTYDRNRLLTASSGGTSASYNYDPFGRLNTVTSGGEIIESYEYDGFDRTTEHSKMNDSGALDTTTYDYDPLDRTTSKTTSGKTTSFDYLGLSNKVVSEEIDSAQSRSYTYNAWGKRLSQIKHDPSAGTEEASYYGYNLHSDVETLTGSDGQTVGTYGYTAYGKDDDTSFTGVDKPDPNNPDAEPYNAYRFNGKRWDPNSESYDMGFRDYSPGLNRFLTRDTYNGALANMGLTTDPWTGNRYAFTGGNPISRIEIDGHKFADAHLLDDSDQDYSAPIDGWHGNIQAQQGQVGSSDAGGGLRDLSREMYTLEKARVLDDELILPPSKESWRRELAKAKDSICRINATCLWDLNDPWYAKAAALEICANNPNWCDQEAEDPLPMESGYGRAASSALKAVFPSAFRTMGRNADAGVSVYLGRNKSGEKVYVGITNNIGKRAAKHARKKRSFTIRQISGTSSFTRGEARAVEQAIMNNVKGLQNVRNSISPQSPYYREAVEWGEAWLRVNAPNILPK